MCQLGCRFKKEVLERREEKGGRGGGLAFKFKEQINYYKERKCEKSGGRRECVDCVASEERCVRRASESALNLDFILKKHKHAFTPLTCFLCSPFLIQIYH